LQHSGRLVRLTGKECARGTYAETGYCAGGDRSPDQLTATDPARMRLFTISQPSLDHILLLLANARFSNGAIEAIQDRKIARPIRYFVYQPVMHAFPRGAHALTHSPQFRLNQFL
jgi:hypothetical protein